MAEILGRSAPAGTSVEPAFELTDEGLGARVDPTRPAIVRAYLPAGDGAAAARLAAEASEALGHLQAFGLRPIGELTTRLVHEADWAEAWKAHFPVLRVGRRLVIRPTWRRHRRSPDDVVLALDPGMAFGTGLHPTTRLCLAGVESLGRPRARWTAPASSMSAAAPGSSRSPRSSLGARDAAGARHGPDRHRRNVGQCRPQSAGAAGSRRARAACRPASDPSTSCSPTSLPASSSISARLLRDEVRPGGVLLASGIFIDREPEVRESFARVGLDVGARSAEGEWVALEAVRR